MTALLEPQAARSSVSVAALSPAELVAGPCALPNAPLAMPMQVIEPRVGLLRRLLSGLIPHHPAAPSAGAGL